MGWPIDLTKAQGEALIREVRLFLDSVSSSMSSTRSQISTLIYMMETGIALDEEEQVLLRYIVLERAKEMTANDQHYETAVFKLFGVWCIIPAWFHGTIKLQH